MESRTSNSQAKPSAPLVRPIFRFLLAIPVGLVVVTVCAGGALKIHEQFPGANRDFIFFLLANPALLLLSWLFLKFLDRYHFHCLGLWFYPGWGKEVWKGVACGAGLIFACSVILLPGPWLDYAGKNPDFRWSRFLFLAVFLLLAASLEEIVFRGYLFQRLLDSIGPLGAMLVLSALFGAAHLQNPSATALSTANTLLAGILLAVAYLKTRGLWLPIALHWSWNLFLGPVFSLPISGMKLGPTMFLARVSGPEWLTGGEYGLEGSVVLTVVCTLVVVWLWLTPRVRPTGIMAELSKDPQQA
jgi:membrane protease YdiL (CAAX protease family)